MLNRLKSLISYFCSCFCECCQCLSNWEVQTWEIAPCHNCWNSAVILKLVSLWFMHSTLRYSPKRKEYSKAFLPLMFNHCFFHFLKSFGPKLFFQLWLAFKKLTTSRSFLTRPEMFYVRKPGAFWIHRRECFLIQNIKIAHRSLYFSNYWIKSNWKVNLLQNVVRF